MKKKCNFKEMKIKVIPILLLLPFFAFSQTAEEKRKLASFSNKEANAVLTKELQKEEQQRKLRLDAYLKSNPQISKVETTDDGFGKKELMDVLPNGEKIYAQTHNFGSAQTSRADRLYNGGSLGLNIQGQGMTAAVWDGGNVLDTHDQFQVNGLSKVMNMDGYDYANHPTHVAGTIAATGNNNINVRGVAFNSSVISYDWTSDLTEMANEAAVGTLVSNHSYGMGALGSIWFFGAYDSRARSVDQITFNNQYYLPVFSAGNSRNSTESPANTQNAAKIGYDLIYGHGNAKNILTVAAVNSVPNYIDVSSVQMSNFSSWGPSDDGRIKPDISTKGVGVVSPISSSNTAINSSNGTSMAAPGITGVVLLLQQYYNQLYSSFMKASTVKGLILHTADEAGIYDGPDYEFGWGLVNTERAATVIRDKNLTNNRTIIEEAVLNNNQTFTKTVSAFGNAPLKVSISWTDPASTTVNNGTVDPSTLYLVNDLDVKVTSNGVDYFPWKGPGMSNPWGAATKNSTNNVDNFERVDISSPNGTYTISVTHKGNLVNNLQNFSLIVTGQNISVLGTDESQIKSNEVRLYPNPTADFIYLKNISAKGKVSILDASGRILSSEKLNQNKKVSVEHLTPGQYYLIYAGDNGEQWSSSFIKKN